MSAKIQSTASYEIFEVCSFNRDVRKLDSLIESMRKHGFIPAYPLHCRSGKRGKLLVKGGHHRLESAKRLKLPVFYVVTDDDCSVHELEKATRPWSYEDFVLSHARDGSSAHVAIMEFSKRTGISLGQATSMIGGESAVSRNLTAKAREGRLQIKDSSHAESVGKIVVSMKSSGVAFSTHVNLVSAISSVIYVKEFEPDVFCHRVATNMHMMVKQATYSQYLDLVEKIYNFSARSKIPLAFMARELAKKRAPLGK